MLTAVLDVLAVVLLALGSITMTISVYGVLRMPDVYTQLHAAGMASGLGAIAILLASIATRDAATITDAALVIAFLLLTAPISGHAIAWAAYRRHPTRPAASREPGPSVE
ncbi:MAG TPA: monovalent cation/H(+) antiporter subunit G [Methylomirabilota bacterium]|jgi:multicomponent Na+:H+ antiporter subunit G|nr:monovalent cation/H(+) antiporter subunit G [Methylomirabilota bacterium]